MSSITLDTIHKIERESSSFSFRLSSFWLNTMSFWKKWRSWSFKKWFNQKLICQFSDLNTSLTKVNSDLKSLSDDETKELYQISTKAIKHFIQLKELLEEVNYFDNRELNTTLNNCLNTLFITEAKTKKNAKSKVDSLRVDSKHEDDLKNLLSAKSKASLVSKI